ncbi:MAG: prolyl oligopeptidase family serine peptidase [Actinomycetota bacterium]|nr:prolyl oligopeptidase family serine peptidase [Actinomycetota bacterium]
MSARTLRFTLGEPRNVMVTADGCRVLFVRTPTGTDRTGALWEFDVAAGAERLLADPAALLGEGGEQLSPQERARRERARESAGGIVAFTVDDAGSTAVFPLSGAIWVCDLATASSRELTTGGGAVIDPRIDPTGRTIGYATSGGAFRVIGIDGSADRALAEPDSDTVFWGQAEFVAAEEMDRSRGFWWAPDGDSLLVERFDVAPVPIWYLADPAVPSAAPTQHRYPVAGSADAEVSLWHVTLDGQQRELASTSAEFPYLTSVCWTGHGDPVVQSMSRDQRHARITSPNLTDGTANTLAELHDATWIELLPGVPCLAPTGGLLSTVDDEDTDTRRLALDGALLSPAGLQIRSVQSVADDGALVRASGVDPTSIQLVRIGWDGTATELSAGPGVHQGLSAGRTTVIISSTLDVEGPRVVIFAAGTKVGTLQRFAEPAGFEPRVTLLRLGQRQLAAAVLFPTGHAAGSARLPVLMAPYGGPHGQLVQQQRRAFLQAQYLADQGFCVIVADGRGTPGRCPAWEKAVRDEFASVTLQDQVDALAGVAEQYPEDIDTARVGILGWSYGGYLSALAVLARPDVFHAAVAGAPVTDWELYDTFYTERYLGHPAEQPAVYRRNSLLDLASQKDAPLPPLLILHGLVDDNVVVAHTLRLSSALLAAGRPHAVLPLTGVTHMTPQEEVAENLLNLQVEFLQRALSR